MAAAPAPFDTPTLPACWPPAEALPAPPPAWRRLAGSLGWLPLPRADATLQAARDAFTACLADLPPPGNHTLCQLLGHARSIDELWHLRPEVYRQLALHHSEAEAARRLARLRGWFAAQRRQAAAALPGT